MRKLLLLGLIELVSGCATKQAATTYWTTKGGVVVVHHVVGKLDTTEKLEQKQLSEDKLKAVDLPKGNYFDVVEGHDQVISRPASVPPRKNTEKPKKDNLAEVTSQIRDLKRQVQAVQAQNQRLLEQLAAPTSEKTAQQDHPDRQDPDVRLSQ